MDWHRKYFYDSLHCFSWHSIICARWCFFCWLAKNNYPFVRHLFFIKHLSPSYNPSFRHRKEVFMKKHKQASSRPSMLASALKPGHSKQHGFRTSHNHFEVIVLMIALMFLIERESALWELVWCIYLITSLVCSCYCITTLRDLLFARLRTGEWNYEYLRVFRSKLCRVSVMWLIYILAVVWWINNERVPEQQQRERFSFMLCI